MAGLIAFLVICLVGLLFIGCFALAGKIRNQAIATFVAAILPMAILFGVAVAVIGPPQ